MGGVLFRSKDATTPLLSDDQLQELRRFAELGRLSASLLHEIANPLTAASLHLEQYDNREAPNIRQARQSIQLLQRYVEAARQQVRHESLPTGFAVRPQLDQIKRLLTPLGRQCGVKLQIDSPPSYTLFGDPVKFQHIITNLVINAIESYKTMAASGNKLVHIELHLSKDWLTIDVLDYGAGIPAEHLPRVFKPFYTTKGNAGRGLGIGLADVRRYVESDFRGMVSATSSPRSGTRFSVKLPLPVQPTKPKNLYKITFKRTER